MCEWAKVKTMWLDWRGFTQHENDKFSLQNIYFVCCCCSFFFVVVFNAWLSIVWTPNKRHQNNSHYNIAHCHWYPAFEWFHEPPHATVREKYLFSGRADACSHDISSWWPRSILGLCYSHLVECTQATFSQIIPCLGARRFPQRLSSH